MSLLEQNFLHQHNIIIPTNPLEICLYLLILCRTQLYQSIYHCATETSLFFFLFSNISLILLVVLFPRSALLVHMFSSSSSPSFFFYYFLTHFPFPYNLGTHVFTPCKPFLPFSSQVSTLGFPSLLSMPLSTFLTILYFPYPSPLSMFFPTFHVQL